MDAFLVKQQSRQTAAELWQYYAIQNLFEIEIQPFNSHCRVSVLGTLKRVKKITTLKDSKDRLSSIVSDLCDNSSHRSLKLI